MDETGNEISFADKLDQQEDYYVLTQDYLKKKPEILKKLVDYWRSENFYNFSKVFKLALIITKNDLMSSICEMPVSGGDGLYTQVPQIGSGKDLAKKNT